MEGQALCYYSILDSGIIIGVYALSGKGLASSYYQQDILRNVTADLGVSYFMSSLFQTARYICHDSRHVTEIFVTTRP